MPDKNRSSAGNLERRLSTNAWIRALENTNVLNDHRTRPLCAMLDDLAVSHGEATALLGENQALNFRDLAALANRYTRWAIACGCVCGDVFCLLMHNCPEYAAIWLGLNRAGCAVALLNTNLSGEALLHGIRAAGSTRIIVGESLLQSIVDVADQIPPNAGIWVSGTKTHGNWLAIEPELAVHAGTPVCAAEREPPGLSERSLLIYTSGTTGLPKAANVTHSRVLEWSLWFAGMMDTRREDRLYNCLPMYHSTGGVVAIGAMLVKGGSVLIRTRFSASRFWDEVVDGGCTIFLYIGELCRYLAVAPRRPNERAHQLRLACGNGLQSDVWQAFQERFGIPHILEFYASTEGNVSLYNCEGRRGAIGRVPPFLAHRFPIALIRLNVETNAPIRDSNGFCIPCDPDEPGEAIGRISDDAGSSMHQFDGYTNAEASAARLLHGVFAVGDRWYRTGDLMQEGRRRLLLFCRSHRRHVSLERRERLHDRGRGGDPQLPRRHRGGGFWRSGSGSGRPSRHGGHHDGCVFRSRDTTEPSRSFAARLRATVVHSVLPFARRHWNIQAGEEQTDGGRLRRHRRSGLVQ